MNYWINKSLTLANSEKYLDKLLDVYAISSAEFRKIDEELLSKIKKAYKNRKNLELLESLMELKKFPIDNPYISFIRKRKLILGKSPRLVSNISDFLYRIGLDTILKLAKMPKSTSRQFGNSFKIWLTTLNIPFLELEEFKNTSKLSFLKGSDTKFKEFAREELGINSLDKGLDFILKIKNVYYLGEAKFLTDHGGTQDNQFDKAMKVARINRKNAKGIAILDGVYWLDSNNERHKILKDFNGFAMSALILEEFIYKTKK